MLFESIEQSATDASQKQLYNAMACAAKLDVQLVARCKNLRSLKIGDSGKFILKGLFVTPSMLSHLTVLTCLEELVSSHVLLSSFLLCLLTIPALFLVPC